MHFPWVKSLDKVIPLRLRRSTKTGRRRQNSSTINHQGDNSIPADISGPSHLRASPSSSLPVQPVSVTREPGLEACTNVPPAKYSESVSLAREASDMAQVALPLVQAIAGVIPLVGGPMQAAIGGLLTGLQTIDRHNQNKADLNSLTLRLNRLSLNLCNAPRAWDPVEQSRRDSFVRMLQDTSAKVAMLHGRYLASTSVTQAIAGCFIEIDRYLHTHSYNENHLHSSTHKDFWHETSSRQTMLRAKAMSIPKADQGS